MLDYGPLRLTLAAVMTVLLAGFLVEESAAGWHTKVPLEIYLVCHGTVVAHTIKSTASPRAHPLSMYIAYFLVTKAGPLMTSLVMGVVPEFIYIPADWAIYFACFIVVTKTETISNILRRSKIINGICSGMAYVSTVYAITGAVKVAAEHSLKDVHALLNAENNNEALCAADWTMLWAVAWPLVLGLLSSCSAVFVMSALRLDTPNWGPDIVRGVANTFAWAGVCVPATVLYDMATNRYHEWWGCLGPYRPSLMAHVEAETLVATWLLSNHCLEWIATHVLGPMKNAAPVDTKKAEKSKKAKHEEKSGKAKQE